ncbi:Setd4 [Symbiodinium sp. KB8]|nr:Setd4 [Symbiodinium sp. KB8]
MSGQLAPAASPSLSAGRLATVPGARLLDPARHLGLGFAPTPPKTWGELEPAPCGICSCMSFSDLHEWFLDNGGELAPGVHVADSVLGGRGLFASSTLSAGSKVLSLPLEACLSSADPSVADLPVNSLFRLTELLCAEIQKGDASRWACWFRSLPRECGSWPEWREPELRAAQRGPPELFKEAVDLARKLPQWHKQLSQILPQSDRHPATASLLQGRFSEESQHVFSHVIAGLDDKASFRRALAILFSRRFGMLCDDSKVAVCVPLGDMINHAATASVEVQYDQASRRLTFVTQDTVVAGDELLICYGQLDNLELCTSHGFVLPENLLDSIVLSDGVKLARTSQLQLPALAEVQQMMEDLPPKDEDEAVRTDTSNSQACRAIASFRLSYRQMLQQLLDGHVDIVPAAPAPGIHGRRGVNSKCTLWRYMAAVHEHLLKACGRGKASALDWEGHWYVAFSEGNDKEEFVIQTLSGDFVVKGENHGRPFYQKLPVRPGTAPPEVYVYYWDGRDGSSFEGWWFGKAVGGNEVWSHCPDKAYLPPLKGWKIPFQGPPRNTFLMMPRTDKVKRENSERAGRAKVLEQEATHVINAAQKAAEEAKATSERDHGSLDPTLLKETEAALKPHLQALLDQLKVLETSGLGESMDAESQPLLLRCVQVMPYGQWSWELKSCTQGFVDMQGMQEQSLKLLQEMLASIMEKFHEAEDLVEKAEITSAMIEHAGDDLAEAQKAAEQTEAIGLKLGMLKQFESDQGRLKATDSLGTFREKLRVANQKLLPFLAAQDTFKAQVEAKNLSDEMEAKLMPAEVEVERAETIAEPLLNFAEAALAAGQAAAEATATPKAKAKTKEKESSKPAKKKGEKHELPTAEVVALAAKHASEAAVHLQGVQKLLDQKRSLDAKGEEVRQLFPFNSACAPGSNQQVLFSTPMKKVACKEDVLTQSS